MKKEGIWTTRHTQEVIDELVELGLMECVNPKAKKDKRRYGLTKAGSAAALGKLKVV